jgi:hypothetical protein
MMVPIRCTACGHDNIVDPVVVRRDRCGRCTQFFDVPLPPPETAPALPPTVPPRWQSLLVRAVLRGALMGAAIGVAGAGVAWAWGTVENKGAVVLVTMVLLGLMGAAAGPFLPRKRNTLAELFDDVEELAEAVRARHDAGEGLPYFTPGTISARLVEGAVGVLGLLAVGGATWMGLGQP